MWKASSFLAMNDIDIGRSATWATFWQKIFGVVKIENKLLQFHDNCNETVCPVSPDVICDDRMDSQTGVLMSLFDIIARHGAYRVSAHYSCHRPQVFQIIIRLELAEVELYRQVPWAACWEGTGGQVVWAGWAPGVSERSTSGSDRVVDCTDHQYAESYYREHRHPCVKNIQAYTRTYPWNLSKMPYQPMYCKSSICIKLSLSKVGLWCN